MDNINYRQKNLLKLLVEINSFKPVKYFAEKLSCSDKTVRNDIIFFEKDNIMIEKVTSKGIRLSDVSRELCCSLIHDFSKLEVLTTDKRRQKILFDLLDGKKISIQFLSDQYFVSKTSIVNDLKIIEDKLLDYNLSLKKSVSGTKLEGKESNIRKALVHMLSQFMSGDNQVKVVSSRIDQNTLLELEEHFGKANVEKVEKIINDIELFLNYKITDPYYINLVTHILISIKRIMQDRVIYQNVDIASNVDNKMFYKASIKMAEKIGQAFNIVLNDSEIFYLYRYLASSGGIYSNSSSEQIDDKYVKAILDDIIKISSNIIDKNFYFSQELYNALMMHLKPMLNRIKYNISIKNPILEQIKIEFPDLLILLKLVIAKIETKYSLNHINEDEISYITLYFQSAIEEFINKKRVIIVCSSGIGTSHLLEKRIKMYFPEWQIQGVLSLKDLENFNIDNTDIIISTVNILKEFKIPIAYVSALFNKTDAQKIREFFTKNKSDVYLENNIKSRTKKYINSIIEESSFIKKIQIESLITINIFINDKNRTEISMLKNIDGECELYLFLKDRDIEDKYIKNIYFWILNNLR